MSKQRLECGRPGEAALGQLFFLTVEFLFSFLSFFFFFYCIAFALVVVLRLFLATWGIFRCGMPTLSFITWGLVP